MFLNYTWLVVRHKSGERSLLAWLKLFLKENMVHEAFAKIKN